MKKLIKNTLFILSIISFVTFQVQAASCALHCELMAEVKEKKAVPMPMKGNHDCCPQNKKESEKPENKNDCNGAFGGSCLHEVAEQVQLKAPVLGSSIDIDNKLLWSAQLLFLSQESFNQSGRLYRAKVPHNSDRHFRRYKSLLELHILKDQFLI